jgi:hypothetical protein
MTKYHFDEVLTSNGSIQMHVHSPYESQDKLKHSAIDFKT